MTDATAASSTSPDWFSRLAWSAKPVIATSAASAASASFAARSASSFGPSVPPVAISMQSAPHSRARRGVSSRRAWPDLMRRWKD
jgi:hypothetical protein